MYLILFWATTGLYILSLLANRFVKDAISIPVANAFSIENRIYN